MTGDGADKAWVSQLRKGLVELLVLAALKREEVYGYQLLQKLAGLNGLALTESTLYPVLGRLADDRLVAVRQVPSPAGPPRRYYRLTDSGGRRLAEMLAHWRQVNGSIEALAEGAGPMSGARVPGEVIVPPVVVGQSGNGAGARGKQETNQPTLKGDGV